MSLQNQDGKDNERFHLLQNPIKVRWERSIIHGDFLFHPPIFCIRLKWRRWSGIMICYDLGKDHAFTIRNAKGEILGQDNGYDPMKAVARKPEYVSDPGNLKSNPRFGQEFAIHADSQGFDITHRFPNGQYKQTIELKPGTILLRYGSLYGSYTAPDRTPFEQLSLPYEQDSCQFHRIMVNRKITVQIIVDEGVVAPDFEQPGGGIQYKHFQPLIEDMKYYKEVNHEVVPIQPKLIRLDF